MSSQNYPNFSKDETEWLVQSAALRPDANVEHLIDSFLTIFPHRAKHEGMRIEEIRQTLRSRINDTLYRKARGYAADIDIKRKEYAPIFSAVFSVVNPLAQMNFYEKTFSDPESKPSDKFKAIQAAEKLKAILFPPSLQHEQLEIKRQQQILKREAKDVRKRLYFFVNQHRILSIYTQLDPSLQEEIREGIMDDKMEERMRDVLEREGMDDKLGALYTDISFKDYEFLSDAMILDLDEQLSNGGIKNMTPDEVDALIQSHLDKERRVAIEGLKDDLNYP